MDSIASEEKILQNSQARKMSYKNSERLVSKVENYKGEESGKIRSLVVVSEPMP